MDTINDPHPDRLTGAIGVAFLLLINILRVHIEDFGQTEHYPNDTFKQLSQTLEKRFDFIIVGAGTAGCVLANRLTENPNWRVLLIEAGNDPSASSEVPAFYFTLQGTSEEWHFETLESRKACLGMINNVCKIIKGKVLGGTSTINNLHYTRANPKDFDDWFKMGNANWGCKHINYFNSRIENYVGTQQFSMVYGTEGNLSLDLFNSGNNVKDVIYKAAEYFGYGKLEENVYVGYTDTAVTVKNGIRINMARAFLTPIKHRKNLYLLKHAVATKVLVSEIKPNRALGIECLIDNNPIQIKAKREVILSAGAINTPILLMLSGYGPKDILFPFKIPVIMDIPVGENLQVHFGVPVFIGIDGNRDDNSNQLYDFVDAVYLYIIHKKGSLATTNINDLVGFINTKDKFSDFPNVAIYHYFFPVNDLHLGRFLSTIGYVQEIKDSLLKHNQRQSIVIFLPTLLKPKSTGSVVLKFRIPSAHISIVPDFLTDEEGEDMSALVAGYMYISSFLKTSAFESRSGQLLRINLPNCKGYTYGSEQYIQCYIRHLAYPQSDVVGTTKMGPMNETCSIVDQDLFVRNVLGLRIVDASIMPTIVSANIQATVAMIADKISERIKEKWINGYIPKPECPCISDDQEDDTIHW